MAIPPQDIEYKKKIAEQNALKQLASSMESYLDQMLLHGARDIYLLKNGEYGDKSIPLDFTYFLNKHPKLKKMIYNAYTRAGWKVKFGPKNLYITLLE